MDKKINKCCRCKRWLSSLWGIYLASHSFFGLIWPDCKCFCMRNVQIQPHQTTGTLFSSIIKRRWSRQVSWLRSLVYVFGSHRNAFVIYSVSTGNHELLRSWNSLNHRNNRTFSPPSSRWLNVGWQCVCSSSFFMK